ncbi:MAG: galactokinase [Pseudomonadales bacterium]
MSPATSSNTTLDAGRVGDEFRRRFADASKPVLAFAPGRVNLIGDHIDYCGGSVLPMPIQFGTWVAAAPSARARIRAESDRQPAVTFDRAATEHPPGHWGRFVSGALAVLASENASLPDGFDLFVAGNIPGSGLSSSASLSVALLLALGALGGCRLDGLDLALAAQRIEHQHVGVACGLMDQAAVVLGRPGAALRFDCATRHARSIPMPGAALSIVVADSGVPRSLAASAYNARRQELDRIAGLLGLNPDTLALTLSDAGTLEDATLVRRARHVASEQRRVEAACTAIDAGDWVAFGALLNASHASLRDDYAVSCAELDALAAAFCGQSGCYGARMTGAGFGGAVVAAVDPARVAHVLHTVSAAHGVRFGSAPRTFVAVSQGGARLHG